ncbi:MAG: hypothetical protein PVF22_06620 [Candidatus Aminicenantes bacterium]|jgi:hypothetical protein
MVKKNIKVHDFRQQYCRSLGHRVPFEYCRSMNSELPCRSTLDCWKDIFPVEDFIQNYYSKEEIQFFLQPPKPKILQIYDSMIKSSKSDDKK